jgi:hypothetical protein
MGCKGIHCPGCKSGSGIGIGIALAAGLFLYNSIVTLSHVIHEIIIGLFILAGIAGVSFGIPVAIVIAITRRNNLVKFYPLNRPRMITTAKVISNRPAIQSDIAYEIERRNSSDWGYDFTGDTTQIERGSHNAS